MDLQALADRLGFELDEFGELAELFLETEHAEMAALKGALAAGDADTVAKKAHSLKGAAGNLGFNETYKLAQELDLKAREQNLAAAGALVAPIEQQLILIGEALAKI